MARTKQSSRKKKQLSKETNVKNTVKNIPRKKMQERKVLKMLRNERKAAELQATYQSLNIQNGFIVVVLSIAHKQLTRPSPVKYLAGYGILPMSGNIPSIRGAEAGHYSYSYLYELKSLCQLFQECPLGQSVTVITKSGILFNFLNGFSTKKNKDVSASKPLEAEIRAMINQRKLVVNSKLHLPTSQQEKDYFKRALKIAAEERDLYIRRQGLDKHKRQRRGQNPLKQATLQNEYMHQMSEVQNQIQQTQQPIMMNSNNNINNNNNSNHVIPTMPFLHQLPYPLQSAQASSFLAHFVNNNSNNGNNNNGNNMARFQTEMHRFDIPSSSSQPQSNPRILHHSRMVHTNQPSTRPLQSLLPSYKQVGMNVENNIGQVNRGGRGGLDYHHNTHQEGQQQQEQQPHVHTTARGTVAGSSSSSYSMMCPQAVTTTTITINTPAVAYNGNNNNERIYRGDNNNNNGGSGENNEISGNIRLVGTGNHDDDDDEGMEEVFVDALDNIENQQESQNGVIGTMKEWVSNAFRRFGNF